MENKTTDKANEVEEIVEVEKVTNENEEIKETENTNDPVDETIISGNTENPVSNEENTNEEDIQFDLQEVLKVPEVSDFIAKVRKQEKDKLYAEIKKKDESVKGLETEIIDLNATINAIKGTTDKSQVEVQKTVDALQKTVEELKGDLRRKELALHTEKALKVAGDDLILDLVGGDTEEEINTSIELAKERYREIEERVATKHTRKGVPSVSNPKQESVKQLTQEEIAKMSPEEWAKHRATVKAQLGLKK